MKREFNVLLVDKYNRHKPVPVGHVTGEDEDPAKAAEKARDRAAKLVAPFMKKCQTGTVRLELQELAS